MSSTAKKGFMVVFSILLMAFIVYLDATDSGKCVSPSFYIIPIALLSWNSIKKHAVPAAILLGIIEVTLRFHEFNHTNIYCYCFNITVNSSVYIGVVYAVSKIKSLYENEKALARIDYLTGIPNAKAFSEILEIEIERAKRTKQTLSLAYIDCDNFKYINDEFGHNEGNNALRAIAATMKNNIRKTDYAARLGGDEFVVLLTGASPFQSHRIMEKLKNNLTREMNNHNYPVTFSIGLSTFEHVPASAEEMIKFSDVLMYEVKNTSKDSIRC